MDMSLSADGQQFREEVCDFLDSHLDADLRRAGECARTHAPRLYPMGLGMIGAPQAATLQADYLNNRAASIYGGSNEVQRNILAKATLGL